MRLKFAGEHQHDSEVSGLECEWSGKAQVKLFSISLTSHDWWMEKKKKYNSEDDPKNTIPGQAWRWKHSGGVFWKGYRANSLYWWAKELMSCTVTYRARQEQLACGVAYSQPPDPNPIQSL